MQVSDDNIHPATVAGFGEEWSTYDQLVRSESDLRQTFDRYFSEFPWPRLPSNAVGFDAGCGSGRWARFVAPRVGQLIAVDPAEGSIQAAAVSLSQIPEANLVRAAAGSLPFRDASMDFGYSLGVLHHTPEPGRGLADCVRCLKPGAPFLVYVYYALDGRPRWYRALWRLADLLRRRISALSLPTRHGLCTLIAALVYLPLARSAPVLRRLGLGHPPLEGYADKPFSVMRTDAFDRFATPLELRFTRRELEELMTNAGLGDIRFRETEPFWCAVGTRIAAQWMDGRQAQDCV